MASQGDENLLLKLTCYCYYNLLVTKIFEIARCITCYFYSKQVILLCRHRGLFLAEDATVPNIRYWNISGFFPYYIITMISRYQVHCGICNLQLEEMGAGSSPHKADFISTVLPLKLRCFTSILCKVLTLLRHNWQQEIREQREGDKTQSLT